MRGDDLWFPPDEHWRDRYERLASFAGEWHGSRAVETAYAEVVIDEVEEVLEFRVPDALRAFYCRFGALHRAITEQDPLRDPYDLWIEEGVLVFLDENQQVLCWGVPGEHLGMEDPEVVALEAGGDRWETGETVSAFLTRRFVTETILGAPNQGIVQDPEAAVSLLRATGLEGVASEVRAFGDDCLVWLGPSVGIWAASTPEGGEAARAALGTA